MTQAAPFFIARIEPDGTQCDAWPEQSLLASMEQGGIDWPSSCRNGTCRTCIGHLVEGSVRYDIEWPGLSPEEKAEGCVLPCVAYPESDVVLQVSAICPKGWHKRPTQPQALKPPMATPFFASHDRGH